MVRLHVSSSLTRAGLCRFGWRAGLVLALWSTGCVKTQFPLLDQDQDGVSRESDCDDQDASVGSRFPDQDGDGVGTGEPLEGCGLSGDEASALGGDCDDSLAEVWPGAEERCDGLDNDCDGDADEDLEIETYYQDSDDDGAGNPLISEENCATPVGYVDQAGDCNDDEPAMAAGEAEVCDGLDNDCNDEVDDGLLEKTYYADADGDGLGDPEASVSLCEKPEGYVGEAGDCDDTEPTVGEGMLEVCDTLDNDCDGQVDEGFEGATGKPCVDDDGDGVTEDEGDCDDGASSISPNVKESCDDRDENCSGGPGDYLVSQTGPADFATIQAALDGVDAPCSIVVSPGIYKENLDFKGKSHHLRSLEGAEATILDGGAAGPVVTMANQEQGELEGFTLRNGQGLVVETCCPKQLTEFGGGLFAAEGSPTVRRCIFEQNAADSGGAIAQLWGSLKVEDSVFRNNLATSAGSAILLFETLSSQVEDSLFEENLTKGSDSIQDGTINIQRGSKILISGSQFVRNSAQNAGAILVATTTGVTISACDFEENTAEGLGGAVMMGDGAQVDISFSTFLANSAGAGGGGVLCQGESANQDLVLTNSRFEDNDGGYAGGGIYLRTACAGEVASNYFLHNVALATGYGAGVSLENTSKNTNAPLLVHNNLIIANEAVMAGGLGVWLNSNFLQIYNNTISDNTGIQEAAGVAFWQANPIFRNNLVTFNEGRFALYYVGPPAYSGHNIAYNDFYGSTETSNLSGLTGQDGNYSLDPQYWDRSSEDYRLGPGSQVVDLGSPDAAYNDTDGSRNDPGAYGGPAPIE